MSLFMAIDVKTGNGVIWKLGKRLNLSTSVWADIHVICCLSTTAAAAAAAAAAAVAT